MTRNPSGSCLLMLCWGFLFLPKPWIRQVGLRQGQDAEARQNYEQAFDYFKQAYVETENLRYGGIRATRFWRLRRKCIMGRFSAMPANSTSGGAVPEA